MKVIKIDFHVHSVHSTDAYSTLDDIARVCKLRQIDGIVLADNCIEVVKKLRKQIICIPGCEIKTEFGEVFGAFINESVKGSKFFEVVDEIKAMGGLVGVPHPFDFFRRSSAKLNTFKIFKHVDFIEAFNSRCLLSQFNSLARKFCKKINKPMVAGSDAHIPLEIGSAYVKFDSKNLKKMKEEILENKVSIFGKLNPWYVHLFTLRKKYF